MYNAAENLFDALPFRNLSNYDVELLFETSKKRIQNLMSDHRLLNYIKEQNLSEVFNSNEYTSCKYYDEEQFNKLDHNKNSLNVFSFNIRSLPKHGGELSNFLSLLNTEFQVIILTEIGRRNLTVVEHLLPSHHPLIYAIPEKNQFGGVGIFISKSIENFEILTDIKLEKQCDCSVCEYESLVVNIDYGDQKFTVLGVYRHPNGNVAHFSCALNSTIEKCDKKRTLIYAADSNIDLINYEKKLVEDFLTMMLDNNFIPFVTLPTRLTYTSATCIDHIFVRYPWKQVGNMQVDSGMFFL